MYNQKFICKMAHLNKKREPKSQSKKNIFNKIFRAKVEQLNNKPDSKDLEDSFD